MDLNFSTADIAALDAASKPDAVALAELEGRTGINSKQGAMQIFIDTNISTSIYDVKPNQLLENRLSAFCHQTLLSVQSSRLLIVALVS